MPSHRFIIAAVLYRLVVNLHALARSRLALPLAWCLVAVLLLATNPAGHAAPRIDGVCRSTQTAGRGVDFSPCAEDDRALNQSSPFAGTFAGNVARPIARNDNLPLFTRSGTPRPMPPGGLSGQISGTASGKDGKQGK